MRRGPPRLDANVSLAYNRAMTSSNKRALFPFFLLALFTLGAGGGDERPTWAAAVVSDVALYVKRAKSNARFTPALYEGGELREPSSCALVGEALACEFDAGTLTLTPEERGVALH